MSRAKCHRESYESGGSLGVGVVSRFARMHEFIDLFYLRTSKRLSVGELIRVNYAYNLTLYT